MKLLQLSESKFFIRLTNRAVENIKEQYSTSYNLTKRWQDYVQLE